MLLTSIDPFLEFERQFDRLTRPVFGNGERVMPMDGIRREGDVLLRFDLPGVDPDSIDVTVDRGVLTVSARRDAQYSDKDDLFVHERPTGTFTRRVYLSEHLDSEKIDAAYDNGVLAVRIPVLEKAKPRKVAIQRGDETKAIKA